MIGSSLAFGLLTIGVVSALMRGWKQSFQSAIAQIQGDTADIRPSNPAFPFGRDFYALLDAVRSERTFAEGLYVEWSPSRLSELLREELPGAQVMIVSNREPYI